MKSNAESYANFLPDMNVHAYCLRHIEPFSVELDHVGLQALATAIINDAGMAIEVLYLDRSAGGEVTPHRLPVLDAHGNEKKGGPTIRLLYRPCVSQGTWTHLRKTLMCSRGHYDLLYKTEDLVEMSRPFMSNPEARFMCAPQISLSKQALLPEGNMEYLTDIPGFSFCVKHIPLTPASTEPYPSKIEFYTSTPRTMAPGTPIYPTNQKKGETFSSTPRTTTPATPKYSSVDPAVKEEHSPKTAINSPVSPISRELPIQADFKPRTKQQRKYDRRWKGQADQVQSEVLKE